MAPKNKEIRERFIAKIRPFKRVQPVPRMSSVYTTFNEVLLDVRYSGPMETGRFWFFIDTHRLNQWRGKQRFIECFLCGDENTAIMVPDDKIFEWYEGIQPNRKGHLFMTIAPEGDRLTLKVGHGRPDVDGKGYLNRYDLISPIIPRPDARHLGLQPTSQTAFEDVKTAILSDDQLEGDSLHEKVISMLCRIGEWSGFEPKKSHQVEPKSPYFLDVVWLKGDEMDLAAEVHDGGNETEAKDRVRHALRCGARKAVVVSNTASVARLRSVCQFEPDLKNWLEIWSIPRVYKMYRNAREFYEEFVPFRKRQRSDTLTEYL